MVLKKREPETVHIRRHATSLAEGFGVPPSFRRSGARAARECTQKSSGAMTKSSVRAPAIWTERRFKALTLARIFRARSASSISCRPEPSTSQTPPCPMFHRPVWYDSKYPYVRNSGGPMATRARAGA